METENMAVRKKSTTDMNSDSRPVSTASKKPAAATTPGVAAKKKAAPKKAAAVKKKSVTRKQATAVAKKQAPGKNAAPSPARPVISQQQRQQMIGDAAYLISIKRAPWQGSPETDWMSAETVIDMVFDVAD
jgi:hypothetical protein